MNLSFDDLRILRKCWVGRSTGTKIIMRVHERMADTDAKCLVLHLAFTLKIETPRYPTEVYPMLLT